MSAETESRCVSQGRKRRRSEVPNPANTLDGLVARRAEEGNGLAGRYMTENEAIESPEDQIEVQGVDPDVATRTCSICGYQGKWVSEMIRHKRVHIAERPFKCRYCTRTSKWKADLIRHVAKTHGIRVVSKYSRSKAFESSRAPAEEPSAVSASPSSLTSLSVCDSSPAKRMQQVYACNACHFEHESWSLFVVHARAVHALAPVSCGCGLSFDALELAHHHALTRSLPLDHATPNFTVKYKAEPTMLSPASSSSDSVDSGVHSDTDESEQDLAIKPLQILPLPLNTGLETLLSSCGLAMSPMMSPLGLLPAQPPLDLNALLLALRSQSSPALLSQASTIRLAPSENSAFRPLHKHNEGAAGCSLCEAIFPSELALTNHLSFHGSGRVHACFLCNYAAGTPLNLERHLSSHHKQRPGQVLVSLQEVPEETDDTSDEEKPLDIEF